MEVYSFLQLANFVSFDEVFSTKLIEIDNIYNSIRENLLSNAISVELEEVDETLSSNGGVLLSATLKAP